MREKNWPRDVVYEAGYVTQGLPPSAKRDGINSLLGQWETPCIGELGLHI